MIIVLKEAFLYKTSRPGGDKERKRLKKKEKKKNKRMKSSHLMVEEPVQKLVESLLEELPKKLKHWLLAYDRRLHVHRDDRVIARVMHVDDFYGPIELAFFRGSHDPYLHADRSFLWRQPGSTQWLKRPGAPGRPLNDLATFNQPSRLLRDRLLQRRK